MFPDSIGNREEWFGLFLIHWALFTPPVHCDVYYSRLTIYYLPRHAPIAQLDRASDFESEGRRFESCWVHHSLSSIYGHQR